MDKTKIEKLDPTEYTHLPHEAQHFEDHEQTDVAIRPLVWTLVVLAVVLVVTGVGMWGLFKAYVSVSEDDVNNQRLSQVETIGTRQVPAGFPDLQGIMAEGGNPNSAAQDMNELRDRNALLLAGRAPMRAGMKPGIPIDRAIDEALAKGIFKTGGATTQPATAE